jgi:anti-sigma factor RsiW
MPAPERYLLLRHLTGDLPPEKSDRVERLLKENDEARARLDQLRALQSTLASVDCSFDDGFADRVLSRLPDGETVPSGRLEPALYDVLQDVFLRVALVTALLIGAIGGYNIAAFDDDTTTPVEAALGLPDATLQAAAHDALLPPEE